VGDEVAGFVVGETDLRALALHPVFLHRESQAAEAGDEQAARQVESIGPFALRQFPLIPLGQERARLKQRAVRFAGERLSHEAGEKARAPARQFARRFDLLAEQFQKVGRLEKRELRLAIDVVPDAPFMRRGVGAQEIAHLLGVHRLDFDLRHGQFLAAQGRAVIEAAAGKQDRFPSRAAARRNSFQPAIRSA
jgi:hypothetical protein